MNLEKLESMRRKLQTYNQIEQRLQRAESVINHIDEELYITIGGCRVTVSDESAKQIRKLILEEFTNKRNACLSEMEEL